MSCNPWTCNDRECKYCNATPHKNPGRSRVANHDLLEKIKELENTIDNYECIMYAAAIEIEDYWNYHTDTKGFGPITLLNYLKGILKPKENPYPQFSRKTNNDSSQES